MKGIYLLDHTTPGWPQLETSSYIGYMDPGMTKRLRVNRSDAGSVDIIRPNGALHNINWWWSPILLR